MKRFGTGLGLAVVLLSAWPGIVAADEPANAPVASEPPSLTMTEPLKSEASQLRKFHTGAWFLLRGYASLDALVGAVDRTRDETQAFWIGASSVLVPGAGQLINGDSVPGGLLLFASGASTVTLGLLPPERTPRPGHEEQLAVYYAVMTARDGLMEYAMLQAANSRYRMHHDRSAAMWTGAASVVPGVGQAINGEWWAAVGCLVAWTLTAVASADLEASCFTTEDTQHVLARTPATPHWSVAWLPSGAAVSVTQAW